MKIGVNVIYKLTLLITLLFTFLGYAQSEQWISKGIGAGGGLFVPSISPHNNNEYFVPTDMGAMFHTTNKGASWETIHFKEIMPSINASVQFTSDKDILYAMRDWNSHVPVKSTNGGITWEPITDPTGNEALQIFADDSRTDRVIVSNYSHIYFSNDAGNTFTEIYSTSNGSGIHIGGTFWDGDLILIATNYGILESNNAGASFSINTDLVVPAGEGISSFTGAKQNGIIRLYCVTLDTNSIYGGLINNGDFYDFKAVYKADYGTGTNWTKISNGFGSELRFMFIDGASNDINTVYIAGGDVNTAFPIVYKTTDAGNTWTDVFKTNNNENIYTGWSGYQGDENWWYGEYALGLDVAANNSDVAIMTDLGFVHSTHDGGTNWYQNYVDPADQNPKGQPTPKKKAYHGVGIENTSVWWLTWIDANNIFASFTDITAIRSTDGGESWSMNYNNLDINTVYMVRKHATNGKLYAATSDVHDMYQETKLEDNSIDNGKGDIRVSGDNGVNWEVLHDFGMPVVWIEFDPANPNRLYASVVNSSNGGIYKCDDVTASPTVWTKLTNPPRTEGHPYNIKILNDGALVVTFSGRIYNDSFTQSSGVFISTDGGTTWEDRSHNDMKYWTKDITIDPTDANQNTWYACVNSGWGGEPYDMKGLFKTTDRGLTWTKILDLFRVESCAINPNNTEEMVVTTYQSGLWATQNLHANTPEFTQIDSYPFKHPMRVFYDPYDADKVWVVNFGGGIRVGNVSLLPVELESFNASLAGKAVELNWQTATEVNNYGFYVERKIGNDEWKQLGFVEGSGNSNSPKKYKFTDVNLDKSGTYYYRLKQVDMDGTYKYSQVVEINLSVALKYSLNQNYPNPFNPETNIGFTIPKETNVRLVILNALGEEVSELINEKKKAGYYSYSFNADKLSSGVYYYKLITDDYTQTKRMILLK